MLHGVASALSRSADRLGVFVVGSLLTLLAWVVTPAWIVGVVAAPPLVLLAPIALTPALVARGYFVRVVADAGATGNRNGAPPFVAWNDLYRDGLTSLLLSALLLAPLALFLVVVAVAVVAVGTGVIDPTPAFALADRAVGSGGSAAVVVAAGGALFLVVVAYLLAFAYVRPAALAAFAASGRLRDGLRPTRVSAVVGSGTYATAWVIATATLTVGYVLAAPFVPLIVGVAFVFVLRIAAHALYGRGSADALAFDDAARRVSANSSASSLTDAARRVSANPSASSLTDAASRGDPGAPAPGRAGSPAQDGGFRRAMPEASAAVQTGRTVPFEGDGGPDDTEFEWGTAVDPEAKS
jgi:hypothetical protein